MINTQQKYKRTPLVKTIKGNGQHTSTSLNKWLAKGWCILATYQPGQSGDDLVFVMAKTLPNLKISAIKSHSKG